MHNPPKSWILWNQWAFAARDKNYGMDGVKGRIAGQIIENVLYKTFSARLAKLPETVKLAKALRDAEPPNPRWSREIWVPWEK